MGGLKWGICCQWLENIVVMEILEGQKIKQAGVLQNRIILSIFEFWFGNKEILTGESDQYYTF